MIRWITLKGLATIILFLLIAVLAEYLVFLYAISLGVEDKTLFQWSFQIPATNSTITIAISPLFHLVPLSVIITLAFSWTYLTKHMAVKPQEVWREKTGSAAKPRKESKLKNFFGKIESKLLRARGIAYLWQRIHFARATVKSALTVFLVFLAFALMISLLAYPNLVYQTIMNAYKGDPSLLSLIRSIAHALAPIGGIFAVVNSGLLSVAPGFRDFVWSLGTIIKPLVDLDNVGKYLVLQNVAAWVSALAVLFYGERMRKGYRYKKSRRSYK